ncbi:MAG: hypothetical protein ABI178_05740 [Rhodanobacter sp.]
MSRIEVVAADTPLGERLVSSFSYPLRGAGLATCTVLALIHFVGLLPSYVGALGSMLVWAATWRYAADCLLRTANGYADPPDVGLDSNSTAGWGLTAIHLLVVALCVLAIVFWPGLFWPVLILAIFVLPAIDMSLAFDANMALALNPLNWARIVRAFGTAYLVPVAINLLLGITIVLASLSSALLPRVLALPLFGFAFSWLIVLAFHWMGVLIHQRHERFGMEPEAPRLAQAAGQDGDATLLQEVAALATDDVQAATGLLVERLRTRSAPAAIHLAYRQLLQRQQLRDPLLVHGQIWIAALIAQGESRRALGVLQECAGLDADFVPDDPHTCGELADLAARLGMRRIAVQLCLAYLQHWPRDTQAPHYGLLASRLLAEHAERHAEAMQLLDQLASAWPEHPLRAEIEQQRQRLVTLA